MVILIQNLFCIVSAFQFFALKYCGTLQKPTQCGEIPLAIHNFPLHVTFGAHIACSGNDHSVIVIVFIYVISPHFALVSMPKSCPVLTT